MNPSKFFGRFDVDFAQHKPMWYRVRIDVPVIANGIGRGSISINNQPYLLYRITHAVLGATFDWQTTGLYQDGQYSVTFRDENSNYQNDMIMAENFFGPNRTGHYLDFPLPIAYSGNRTLNFEVTNNYARVLTPEAEYYTVELALHGIADWGKLQGSV